MKHRCHDFKDYSNFFKLSIFVLAQAQFCFNRNVQVPAFSSKIG